MYNVTMHIGQAEIPALVAVGQLFVIEAEEMQNGGVQVVHMDGIFLDTPADLVG